MFRLVLLTLLLLFLSYSAPSVAFGWAFVHRNLQVQNVKMWPFSSGKTANTAISFIDVSPSWEELESLLRSKESTLERSDFESERAGRGPTNHRASIRLFDAPDGFQPEITLYRDQAAWCPYCEKVWLQLEEKRIPYRVEKAPLRCYGEKSREFLRVSPRGMLPVASIRGRVISESNDIIFAIEQEFTQYTSLLPTKGSAQERRMESLFQLERQAFSAWFTWLTSPQDRSGQMDAVLRAVDAELAESAPEGPYFLGKSFSVVDVMFAPFLERMAASLPYFKGFESRTTKYPNLLQWYEAMDSRPAYRGIKSDYYTHCHDLPPQIGACFSIPAAEKFATEIDGGAWSLSSTDFLEPMLPESVESARDDAVRRIIGNHEAVVRFSSRAVGYRGSPSVAAPLADPNAQPGEEFIPAIDSCFRMVCFSMLVGIEPAEEKYSQGKVPFLPVPEMIQSLSYFRDRIGVPRDMSIHAAQKLRAHLNWFMNSISKASHMFDT